MKFWPIRDAKAHFDELLEACLTQGPQMVTRRGAAAAVLVPLDEWQRLQTPSDTSLKELLLSDAGRTETLVPQRAKPIRRRATPAA